MSRPIKFRVWVPQLEGYGEVLNIHFSEEGLPEIIEVFINGSNHHLNAFEVVLEQYTGLKDKNGVKIHEGDIIRYKLYADSRLSYIDEVFYSTISGAFMAGDEYNIRTLDCLINVEVIGNVHENSYSEGSKNDNQSTKS